MPVYEARKKAITIKKHKRVLVKFKSLNEKQGKRKKNNNNKAYTSSITYVCLHRQAQPLTNSLHTPPVCNKAAHACQHSGQQLVGETLRLGTVRHNRPLLVSTPDIPHKLLRTSHAGSRRPTTAAAATVYRNEAVLCQNLTILTDLTTMAIPG